LQLDVDEHGVVKSVEVKDGPTELRATAVALAQAWKYRSFPTAGKPQKVTFTEYISILPPERAVRSDVPFPTVHDWGTVMITMTRTRCFGSCPDYQVQIRGTGDLAFKSTFPKEVERQKKVSREELERLMDKFRAANFYAAETRYEMPVTDLPTCSTYISINGQSMSVTDYGGWMAGMPASLRDVELAIDELAGTAKWLGLEKSL
jgi:Domain of unknown function (DUF6438)